jgi:hypothetical protein
MISMKNLYIMANFIINDREVDCYSGQVQYYFKHEFIRLVYMEVFFIYKRFINKTVIYLLNSLKHVLIYNTIMNNNFIISIFYKIDYFINFKSFYYGFFISYIIKK